MAVQLNQHSSFHINTLIIQLYKNYIVKVMRLPLTPITHNGNEKYWSEASVEQWAKEMAGK